MRYLSQEFPDGGTLTRQTKVFAGTFWRQQNIDLSNNLFARDVSTALNYEHINQRSCTSWEYCQTTTYRTCTWVTFTSKPRTTCSWMSFESSETSTYLATCLWISFENYKTSTYQKTCLWLVLRALKHRHIKHLVCESVLRARKHRHITHLVCESVLGALKLQCIKHLVCDSVFRALNRFLHKTHVMHVFSKTIRHCQVPNFQLKWLDAYISDLVHVLNY